MEGYSFIAAFGAGLASFLSPCVLPLVPVFLASLAGPGFLTDANYDRKRLFFYALSFVAGFGILFTLAGALVGLAGIYIGTSSLVVRITSGIILILLGGVMLLALKWPVFSIEKRFNLLPGHTGGILRAALIGGSFALAWTPCLSPVLGGILMLALNSSTAWQGAYLLAVYSLGLGIPFLVIGLAFSTFSTWLNKVKPYSRYIYIISGLVLIVAGILILTGNL